MITTSTRFLTAAALACAALAPAVSHAGDFMVRARVLSLEPANESTGTLDTLGGVQANAKYIWEIDASYFVTPNVALELIATTPQKHTVYLGGEADANKIGTLRHLPPTLTLQYHFAPTNPTVRPYVGLGVNYTHFSAVKLDTGLGKVTLNNKSWGLAYNIGADFPITDKLSFNVDFKKIDIHSEATLVGVGKIGTVKVDPVLFGIGIGYRF